MRKEFSAGPGASRTWLGPTLAAATAAGARAPDRNFERQRRAFDRFARGHINGGGQWFRTLADQEAAANAIDGGSNRRKVDHDFVGKTVRIVTGVVTRHHGDAITAERSESVATHQLSLR